jgi:CRP/FNR family transcriptional regulator, cyclic AMP receptor protein
MINLFRNADDLETFTAGQTIFEAGQTGDKLYVVVEGEVELSHNGRTLEVVGPGSIFGEMALIDSKARSATATAKTESKLASVDQKRFTFLIQQTPFFAIQVMGIMAERLRRETAN